MMKTPKFITATAPTPWASAVAARIIGTTSTTASTVLVFVQSQINNSIYWSI